MVGVSSILTLYLQNLLFDDFCMSKPLKFAIHLDLSLDMVNCVDCKKKFKNDKSYSNHRRHCEDYKLELAQHLHLRQDNIAMILRQMKRNRNKILLFTNLQQFC